MWMVRNMEFGNNISINIKWNQVIQHKVKLINLKIHL